VTRFFIALIPVVLAGCQGYGPNTPLDELSEAQRIEVCEGSAIQAPVLEDCGTPIPVRVEPLAAEVCAASWFPPSCTATVGDWEACQDAISANACALQLGTDACAPLEACGVHLWSSALGLDGDLQFTDMEASDILAVCAVTNDYEPFSVQCDDGPVEYLPIPEACAGFGFGGCGTIGQALDCQVDLLTSEMEDVCDSIFPPSCVFTDCG
jgi:hypothetical protein